MALNIKLKYSYIPDFDGMLNERSDNKATNTMGTIKWMTWNNGLLLSFMTSVMMVNGSPPCGYSDVRICLADTISHSLCGVNTSYHIDKKGNKVN